MGLADLPGVCVTINVANCVEYLRGVGVEITDEQVAAWNDAEKVHRYLRNEKKPKRGGYDMECLNGHWWYAVIGRSRKQRDAAKPCPVCGRGWVFQRLRWAELRDGTIRDFRPKADRWMPLDGPPAENHDFPDCT